MHTPLHSTPVHLSIHLFGPRDITIDDGYFFFHVPGMNYGKVGPRAIIYGPAYGFSDEGLQPIGFCFGS
jgi:hypothetical protein